MKKKVILSSVLTIVLCLSLIAGSTYALFTDSDTVNVTVTAGKVKVTASIDQLDLSSSLGVNVPETTVTQQAGTNIIDINKMVPGDIITFDIVVENGSDVTVDFIPVIKVTNDDGLWSGLTVTFTVNGTATPYTLTNYEWRGDYTQLGVGVDPATITVSITLPESAGNEYQEKTCSFSYTVEVVQGNHDGVVNP